MKLQELVALSGVELSGRRGACYLLESSSLFKLGSSAEPLTRCRVQKKLWSSEGASEKVEAAWVAPMMTRYAAQERVFQYLINGYGKGCDCVRETWRKGVGSASNEFNLDEIFRLVPDVALSAYVDLWVLFMERVSGYAFPESWRVDVKLKALARRCLSSSGIPCGGSAPKLVAAA